VADEVTVICGLDVPIVLRKHATEASDGLYGVHLVLERAFVEGIMEGEVFEEEGDGEVETIVLS
jgi:hypothetical protein